ncbi:hypothetical protein NIES4071_55720 [Calothrix sp. NIES-4071]|nr:hypothetical protein NIES4071_55720 [Calothrix sp. NIES-4071]BAZ59879.1 hypothetical protein NIES4105_55670 [Calothrix sp. NIES-4105]
MTYQTEKLTISISISSKDRKIAKEFAKEQANSEKANQVYINTLAVLAVNHYFEMLDIPTNLQASHSWNPLGRIGADVADLNLPGKGRIECRPIRKGEQFCYFPLEVWKDRIGFLVIEFNETYSEGRILGFVPKVFNTTVAINHLQSLDSLLTALHSRTVVRLSEWLHDNFTPAWLSLEEVLCNQSNRPVLMFCNINNTKPQESTLQQIESTITQLYTSQTDTQDAAKKVPSSDIAPALINLLQTTQDEEIRWKAVELLRKIDQSNPACGVERAIDLSMQFGENAVALTVSVLPKLDGKIAILVKVYPLNNQVHVPPGLQLTGLDEDGNTFTNLVAKQYDNHIQFLFTADIGDKFSLNVKLNSRSINESFLV